MDHPLPKSHPHYPRYVYDDKEQSWYDTRTDLFISDDDAKYLGLEYDHKEKVRRTSEQDKNRS